MPTSTPSITEIAAGALGIKFRALPAKPFVGLRPFNSDEALLFFGRHEQTIELLQQLHRTHFVALVGSSGCGKSSLVRAGLIPRLKAGFLVEEREKWLIATMKPGDAPLENLATVLHTSLSQTDRPALLTAIQSDNNEDVASLLNRLAPALDAAEANLLLLVDQFEELFRFGLESGKPENRAAAKRFVELLLALSQQRQLPVYVVLTMRSDFIGDCDNFYGLPEVLNRGQYLVPRLTREQLRQAIEGPLHLFGASLSPELLKRVLDDVGEQSDQLPVLQHALMLTWEQWQKSALVVPPSGGSDSESGPARLKAERQTPLTVEHYEAVGTLTEALSRDAEAALSGLSEENQKIAERMFQALTDTDARNRQIRRPAHLSELCAITGADRGTIETIIEEFSGSGRSFLISTNEADSLIDISHESLIRKWKRMTDWVSAEADWRDRYKRLSHDAEIHCQSGKPQDLLKGSQLTSAMEWQEKRNPNHAWAGRYGSDEKAFSLAQTFLQESKKKEDEEVARKRRERRYKLIQTRISSAIVMTTVGSILVILLTISSLRDGFGEHGVAKRISNYINSAIYWLLIGILKFCYSVIEEWNSISNPIIKLGLLFVGVIVAYNSALLWRKFLMWRQK